MDDDFSEAVRNGDIDFTLALLDSGIDPNIRDNEGNTGLILASIGGRRHWRGSGRDDIIRLLILYGADPNIKNNYENTALMQASSKGHKEIAELLLDNGADPNIQNDSGNTALIYASNSGHTDIVELLLERGADPTIVNNKGRSFKDYPKIRKIQRTFKEKRTLKRRRAATRIQTRARGKMTRKRDYLSKYSRYKQWRTDEAFDSFLYDDESIYNYLTQNDRNFVLQNPATNSYEAWNADDILQLNKIEGHNDINVFYECRQANHSLAPANIIRDTEYIKLGTSNYVVLLPLWLSNTALGRRIGIPEPRIFKLTEYKLVNGLVSNNILKYGGSHVSGDHCNQLQPIQTYQLELVSEEELIKAQQRLNLSRVLQQSNLPIGLHDLISQRHRTMQHDREVLDRQRQVDRENELMADYLTELDRAARSSSTDELDRRYRRLLSQYYQEVLDEDYLRTRLLLGPRDREQFLRERETARQRSQPQNVARRLFDDDE